MKPSEFIENPSNEIVFSCDEFSIHTESNFKTIRLKKNYGRVLPFIIKEGIVEAVVLPKESEGLFKYETQSMNQLQEAVEFCNSNSWNVTENNFIHLGFWRTHEILDSSECVWGLDVDSMEDTSTILSSKEVVILPIGILLNLGDSIAGAAGLKLLLKTHRQQKNEM
jgi:hypothetical protein